MIEYRAVAILFAEQVTRRGLPLVWHFRCATGAKYSEDDERPYRATQDGSPFSIASRCQVPPPTEDSTNQIVNNPAREDSDHAPTKVACYDETCDGDPLRIYWHSMARQKVEARTASRR